MSSSSKLWAQILSGAAIVGAAVVVARLVQAGRDVLISVKFGTSFQVDAYLLAMAFPLFVITVWNGAVTGAVVPALVRKRQKEGGLAVAILMKGMIFYAAMALTVVTLFYIGVIYAWSFIKPPQSETMKLFVPLALYTSPTIIVSGITALLAGNLNSQKHFALAGLSGVLTPLVSGLVLLAFFKQMGINALIFGICLGSVAELIFVLPKNYSEIRAAAHRKAHGVWIELKPVAIEVLPMIAASLILAFNPIIDQVVSTFLGSGNVAAISFGGKVVAFPLAVAATGMGIAVIPSLASVAAKDDWKTFISAIRSGAIVCFGFGALCAILLIIFARPITALIFQHGEFTHADTIRVAAVQACYAVQIPFYLIGILMVRGLAIVQGTKVLYLINIVGVALNATLDILLGHYWGAAGVALATSCVYFFTAVALSLVVAHYSRIRLAASESATNEVLERVAFDQLEHSSISTHTPD